MILIHQQKDAGIERGNRSLSELQVNKALKEAKIQAGLKHPNIVTLYHSFLVRKDRSAKLNMLVEYAEGGDLR